MRGLYAIVDVPDPHGHEIAAVTAALLGERSRGGAGARVVQLRAKQATTAQRVQMLELMAPLCAAASSLLVVNDDIDAARAGLAGGLHLGQDDAGVDDVARLRGQLPKGVVVGISTHDAGQVAAACRQAPDHIAMGPVLPTASKANPDPVVGFAGLAHGCRLATRPVIAIGGLDEETGARAIGLGAAAVAMIGALQDASLSAVESRAVGLAEALERAAEPLPFERVCAEVPILPPEQLLALAQWSDDLGLLIGLGLPARFRPRHDGKTALYRPSDLHDLLFVLDKQPRETWGEWESRVDEPSALVQLRQRTSISSR